MQPGAQLEQPSVWQALDRMLAASSGLLHQQVELARVELDETASHLARLLVLLVVGGILVALGWFSLSWALIEVASGWLPAAQRFLLVALINLPIGAALVAWGVRRNGHSRARRSPPARGERWGAS
ncbi:MAG TPA: phage holin family protein [Polyangia bacterium]|nr:phage holin family protein [Polyangia bacterium]